MPGRPNPWWLMRRRPRDGVRAGDAESGWWASVGLTLRGVVRPLVWRDGDQPADISETRFPRVQFPIGSQLTGIDLSRSDLTWAGFSGANLTSVNLRAACLTRANLTDANLSNATLYQADLYRAQLGQTNLSGADLRGADLRGVFGQTPEQIRRVARTDEATLFGTAAGPAQSCGPTRLVGTQIHPR